MEELGPEERKANMITPDIVATQLSFSVDTNEILKSVDQLDFNIFDLQKYTQNNELISMVCHLLATQNCFENLNINFETF